MKKFVAIIAVFAIIGFGVVWQKHRAKARALSSGEVYVRDQPAAAPIPLPAPAAQPSGGDEIATTATPQPIGPATSGTASAPAQNLPQGATPPASDSISRNPPNGLAFAGSGKFQLYRQGDITWRLDTQTGDACILFATDTQWRHPRVYQAGCGTHGETTVATGD
jgi:hypothetical protein